MSDVQPKRKRRGRGVLITFIVLLVIVGGVLAVVDRVAVSYAERIIGDKVTEQVSRQKATSEKPDVKIEGIPFLTQVVGGEYREITIGLANFSGPAGTGRTIKMSRLDIRALAVKAPLDAIRTGTGDITASTVTGVGTIGYDQLAELIKQPGLKLTEQGGKLIGTAPVEALGQTYTVTGAAAVTLKDGIVQVRFSDVTAEGLPNVPIVRNLVNNYVKRLAVDLRVPALPLGLKLTKAEPLPDGLRVTAEARDVPLTSAGL